MSERYDWPDRALAAEARLAEVEKERDREKWRADAGWKLAEETQAKANRIFDVLTTKEAWLSAAESRCERMRKALLLAREAEDAYHVHPDRTKEGCRLCGAIDSALRDEPSANKEPATGAVSAREARKANTRALREDLEKAIAALRDDTKEGT